MDVLSKPIGEYDSVKDWFDGYEQSWGRRDNEEPYKLEVLESFCRFVAKDPDTMIAECLRPLEDGYKKIRPKTRRNYIARIEEFEAGEQGGRRAANVVRSFLIHNGVAMSADILR